ncbi:putative tpr repeat nuclear phosphoprotein [Corchorus capsularis]|uniref:Putative tpr repeat nuclear phosphoprotein n=1 Tax=Corchorus capsularis TaxID=210143 RepID=A0A1R3JQ99_COCAP|nr:putative tpr repeat nuclear phosphoprotein [Corchorus capsularis]
MEKKKKKRTSKLPLRRQSFRGREVSGISDFPERTGKRRRRERESKFLKVSEKRSLVSNALAAFAGSTSICGALKFWDVSDVALFQWARPFGELAGNFIFLFFLEIGKRETFDRDSC